MLAYNLETWHIMNNCDIAVIVHTEKYYSTLDKNAIDQSWWYFSPLLYPNLVAKYFSIMRYIVQGSHTYNNLMNYIIKTNV